jgi:hypothetical protein
MAWGDDCCDVRLVRVDHPANTEDYRNSTSRQGYQVFRCIKCGRYHGCRYQWDAGTGSDNRWQAFGFKPEEVVRHY